MQLPKPFLRWTPPFALMFALTACTSSSTSVPPTAPAVTRGAVISLTRTATITRAQMSAGLAGQTITSLGGAPRCDVALYAVKYVTIGIHGEAADASAGFFVPERGCKPPYPLIAYGQGTNVVKAQKITEPTKQNIEPTVLAAIYAAHGDAIAATDYLGEGYSTYPFEPYLVVDAEASAVIDSIRAIRTVARRLGVPLSDKIVLSGHSQGGQTALGTQRTIEAQNASEFHLYADTPSSGPYDLTQTLVDGISHPGQDAPILAAFVLTAYQKTYANVYGTPSDAFQAPYDRWVENLLPVATYAEASKLNGKTLPLQLQRLVQPSFARQFTDDPQTGGRIDAAANDLVSGWKPVAPLYLCGGSRDPEVEFKNSLVAYRFFKGEGANVTLTDVNSLIPRSLPITTYHDAVLVFCHTLMRVKVLGS